MLYLLHLEFKLSCLLPLWECTALLKGTFTSITIEGEIQCDTWQQFDVKVTHVVGYQAPVLHLLGVIVTELEKCNGAIIKKACIEVFLHFFSIIFCQATFPLPLKVDKIHFPHLHYTIYFLWWITSWFWLVVIVTKNATWETICIIFQHSTFSVHKIQPTKYLSQSGVKTTKLACTGLTPSAFGMSLSFEPSLIAQHRCRSSVIFFVASESKSVQPVSQIWWKAWKKRSGTY